MIHRHAPDTCSDLSRGYRCRRLSLYGSLRHPHPHPHAHPGSVRLLHLHLHLLLLHLLLLLLLLLLHQGHLM